MNSLSDDCCIDLVLCRAGGFQIGFEARHVSASHGTAVEGAPLVESVLDLPPAKQSAGVRQRLTLKLPDRERDILVAGPLELVSTPIGTIHPLPSLLAARNYLPGLRALILLPDRDTLLLFDVGLLRFP
jgi:hypothetical protein